MLEIYVATAIGVVLMISMALLVAVRRDSDRS